MMIYRNQRIRRVCIGVGLALALHGANAAAQDGDLVSEGARVYGTTCGSCHNARSPLERTDRQWTVIVNHMRARANLTGSETRAVLAFLQATNLPETGAGMASAAGVTMMIPESLRAILDDAAALSEPPRPAVETASGDAERTPSGRGG